MSEDKKAITREAKLELARRIWPDYDVEELLLAAYEADQLIRDDAYVDIWQAAIAHERARIVKALEEEYEHCKPDSGLMLALRIAKGETS